MKKIISIISVCLMILTLTCGCGKDAEPKGWLRDGHFTDGQGNFLTITLDEGGGSVGAMLDSRIYSGAIEQDGKTLRGSLSDDGGGTVAVTVTEEEGGEGLILNIDGGVSYRFTEANFGE